MKERDLFFDGKWSGDGKTTEYTRVSESYKPVGSSAIRRDISADLKAAMREEDKPTPTAEPELRTAVKEMAALADRIRNLATQALAGNTK